VRTLILSVSVVALGLLASADPSRTREPELLLPGPGGEPADYPPTQFWRDNPDYSANVVSSEVIVGIDLDAEIANDFVVETEGPIRHALWWGAYWNGYDGNPTESGFILRFYRDAACCPENEPFQEYSFPGNECHESYSYGGDMFSQYIYGICVDLMLAPGIYWFSVQMAEHAFPAQWGRQGADRTQSCDSHIRSEYFGHTEWTPVADIIGAEFDAAQMFEDECFYWEPTKVTSWGAIKGLYRE
jgi:hypothetical protein